MVFSIGSWILGWSQGLVPHKVQVPDFWVLERLNRVLDPHSTIKCDFIVLSQVNEI